MPEKMKSPMPEYLISMAMVQLTCLLKVWRNYRHCVSNCAPQAGAGVGSSASGPAAATGSPLDPVYEYQVCILLGADGIQWPKRIYPSLASWPWAMAAPWRLSARTRNMTSLPRSDYVWPVDINADGLADLAWGDTQGSWYFQLNTGKGFTAAELIAQVPGRHQQAGPV